MNRAWLMGEEVGFRRLSATSSRPTRVKEYYRLGAPLKYKIPGKTATYACMDVVVYRNTGGDAGADVDIYADAGVYPVFHSDQYGTLEQAFNALGYTLKDTAPEQTELF